MSKIQQFPSHNCRMWLRELEKDEKTFIALENSKWREKIIMWKTQISPKTVALWNPSEFKMDHKTPTCWIVHLIMHLLDHQFHFGDLISVQSSVLLG